MSLGALAAVDARVDWSNARLVRACLDGDEAAWDALIARYKRLVYSVPMRQGLSPDAAADVFQSVWLTLLTELPRLRDPQALPAWLLRVAAHQCQGRRRREQRYVGFEDGTPPDDAAAAQGLSREEWGQLERAQVLRDALAALPERCRRLLHLLFFEDPPRPYQHVAAELGLAVGSIGFTRARCLERLRARLDGGPR